MRLPLWFLVPSLALASPARRVAPDFIPPLLIWHGLGDSFDTDGMKSVASLAESVNPGTFVHAIRLANDSSGDRTSTFFGNVSAQIDDVCTAINSHPILSQAPIFDGLGFSQGGQFLRGLLERCDGVAFRSLVTFGSQHNGISTFQKCGDFDFVCKGATGLLTGNTWTDFIQSHVVPAQYYRDPEDLQSYLDHSHFLASINNEIKAKSTKYSDAIKKLSHFVMYMFANDTVAIPKESAWFADVNTTSGKVTYLRDRQLYKEDWLGLKHLDKAGRLHFGTVPGEHMHLNTKILEETFATYFGPIGSGDALKAVRKGAQKAQAAFNKFEKWLDL